MKLAAIEKNANGNSAVVVNGCSVFLVSLIATIPWALLLTLFTTVAMPVMTNLLESKKFRLEEQRTRAEILKTALANPDAAQRKQMIEFLLAVDLIERNGKIEVATTIPQWPSTP
jgi:hypothetical protein